MFSLMKLLPRMALATSLLVASVAFAQPFPNKSIKVICPFPPGASADAVLRALAQAAAKEFGQPIIIENRPGAAGTLGPASLHGLSPDGYTLSLATNTLLRQPFIVKTPYDPAKDFTYLIGVTHFELGLVVRAESPWQTLSELVGFAKNNPGKLSYGTIGIGSAQDTVMHRIAQQHGIDWVHVPFKGAAEGLNALSGGHVQMLSETTAWGSFVDAGKFRLLAVYGGARMKRWPNAQTLREQGYDITESVPWGIIGPKGMDEKVIKTLQDGFRKAMDDSGFLKTLDLFGQEPRYMSSDDYRKYIQARIPVEREIVNRFNLSQQ